MSALSRVFAESADFRTLVSINGLSVDEIERRARRIVDKSADALWRVRSVDGFLGANETLRGVLAADWHIVVVQLRLSHELLAAHVLKVMRDAEAVRERLGRGPNASIKLDYDTTALQSTSDGCPEALRGDSGTTAPLLVTKQLYAGRQYSLFARVVREKLDQRHNLDDRNDDDDDDDNDQGTDDSDTIDELMAWNAEYTIENTALGLKVLVGGTVARDGSARGVPSYIERFGFYEGGNDNPYRVPPLVLVAVLSGRVHPGLCDELQRRHDAAGASLLARIDELRQEGARLQNDVQAQQWLASEIQKLEAERAQLGSAAERQLAHLRSLERA
jgi:hypothetical protein